MLHFLALALAFSSVSFVYFPDKLETDEIWNPPMVGFPLMTEANVGTKSLQDIGRTAHQEKVCSFTVNEHDLLTFSQLAHNKLTNIIQLRLYVVDANKTYEILQQRDWIYADRIGQDIEFVFREHFRSTVLTVGKQTVAMVIYENPQGCIALEKNREDFVAGNLLGLVKTALNTGHEICSYGMRPSPELHVRCCKIFGKPSRKCYCYDGTPSAFLRNMVYITYVHAFIAYRFVVFLVCYFYVLLPWQAKDNEKYWKMEESPMSMTRVISMLCWIGSGPFKSYFRRLIFICSLSVSYISFYDSLDINTLGIFFVVYLTIFYPFSNIFLDISSKTEMQSLCKIPPKKLSHFLADKLYFDVRDLNFSGFEGALNLFSLPVNFKRWKTALHEVQTNTEKKLKLLVSLPDRYIILESLREVFIYFTVFLFSFLYVFLATVTLFVLISLNVICDILAGFLSVLNIDIWRKRPSLMSCLSVIHREALILGLIWLSVVTYARLPICLMYFAFGIIVNAAYFTPYIIFISIIVFYVWKFWEPVEDKYFSLKLLIYEECRDIGSKQPSLATGSEENSNCEPVGRENGLNTDENSDEQANILVSRELYDFIREKLLPYQSGLFHFLVKCLCLTVFAYVVLTWIRFLEASDATSTVHVLTTLGISCLPYILKIAVEKIRKEKRNAWKENMRVSVNRLVKRFSEDPKNAGTILIKHVSSDYHRNSDKTATMIHDSEPE